jgi:glycine cleavage system H protein
MNPQDLLYSPSHEWIRVTDGVGTIGITDFAQGQLGDVVYIELPKEGESLTAGKVFGTIESVKAVSELFSPVTGKVLETNFDLSRAPEILNADPYGAGWLLKVQLDNPDETASLLSASRYEETIARK